MLLCLRACLRHTCSYRELPALKQECQAVLQSKQVRLRLLPGGGGLPTRPGHGTPTAQHNPQLAAEAPAAALVAAAAVMEGLVKLQQLTATAVWVFLLLRRHCGVYCQRRSGQRTESQSFRFAVGLA